MVGSAVALAVAIVGAVIGFGGSHPGTNARNPFVLPRQSRGSQLSPFSVPNGLTQPFGDATSDAELSSAPGQPV